MEHKITYQQALLYKEIQIVETKIRSSKGQKRLAALDKFSWWISSHKSKPSQIVHASLVAKTQGIAYYACLDKIPPFVMEYWNE